MKKKVLIFFGFVLHHPGQQAGSKVHPAGLRILKEDEKCAGPIRQGITKRSWTDVVFHHDAKKRLKQHRIHLHKKQFYLVLT